MTQEKREFEDWLSCARQAKRVALLARYPQVQQIELTADDSPSLLAFYRKTGFVPMSELGCCGLMKD